MVTVLTRMMDSRPQAFPAWELQVEMFQ